MKRRILVFFLILIIALGMSACGIKDETESQTQTNVSQNAGNTEKKDTTEGSKDVEKEETPKASVSDEQPETTPEDDKTGTETEVKIYFSNEDATAFATEMIKIPELTAENLVTELAAKGVLPVDVKVIKCEKAKNDGQDVLNLDLSKEIATYLNMQGTTGEMITVGGICNTFLDAFDCKGIKITANGETLTSGHAEYPGYLSYFDSVR